MAEIERVKATRKNMSQVNTVNEYYMVSQCKLQMLV